jgi:hypothetical protein
MNTEFTEEAPRGRQRWRQTDYLPLSARSSSLSPLPDFQNLPQDLLHNIAPWLLSPSRAPLPPLEREDRASLEKRLRKGGEDARIDFQDFLTQERLDKMATDSAKQDLDALSYTCKKNYAALSNERILSNKLLKQEQQCMRQFQDCTSLAGWQSLFEEAKSIYAQSGRFDALDAAAQAAERLKYQARNPDAKEILENFLEKETNTNVYLSIRRAQQMAEIEAQAERRTLRGRGR